MHSHNDELNRYLDSLVLGRSGGSFELDGETIEASSRFLNANHSMSAPSAFVSRLEDSLLKRASMRPVAVTGRIEHIGEGIGLVAAKPLPRRIRIERIAALAAVVLLLLAAGGFYRSDSDKGGNWLMAPVASASPAPVNSVYCLPQEAWIATASANGIRMDYPMAITNPTQISAPTAPGEKIWAVAESQLPTAATVSSEDWNAVESALKVDLACAIEARDGRQNYDPRVLTTTQLADGRVGVLIDQDLVGLGVEQYLIYAPGDYGWLLYEIAYVVPDDEMLENVSGPIQKGINIDLWTTQTTDIQSQSCSPEKVRVAAGQPIDLTVRNLSLLPQTLSIPGVGVEESIAAGATSTISVTFRPGVYMFSSSNAADTTTGSSCAIFATEPSDPAATPTS